MKEYFQICGGTKRSVNTGLRTSLPTKLNVHYHGFWTNRELVLVTTGLTVPSLRGFFLSISLRLKHVNSQIFSLLHLFSL